MWWRTEKRAAGIVMRGRPSLEQLVLGRRVEAGLGDEIRLASSTNPRHLMVAVSHPCSTVANCIYDRKFDCHVVYLSFPISAPRDLLKDGDASGIQEVSDFNSAAYERQRSSKKFAFISPLGIDEIPFVKTYEATMEQYHEARRIAISEGEEPPAPPGTMEFDPVVGRWNLDGFWRPDERLGIPEKPYCPFPIEDVRTACGNMYTDVGWRDYRLVEQADCLAVFNPVFKNRKDISRGVRNEIEHALRYGKPVHIYQDPSHDPNEISAALGGGPGGTMGLNPMAQNIIFHATTSDLFDKITLT